MRLLGFDIGPTALIAYVFVIVGGLYPLARFLLLPLFTGLGPPQVQGLAHRAATAIALGNSVRIGIEAALAALVPGFALAFLLERRTWRGAALLSACLWTVFLAPSYLLTTGWRSLASSAVLRDGGLHGFIFSEAGIVALLALKGLPFACLAARTGWAAIGGEIGAAAAVHVRRSWRRALIFAGLLAPVAAAAFCVVFIEAIDDFGVAATLGAQLHFPLVIYAVYTSLARTPVDFVGAARLSLLLIGLAGIAVAVHQVLDRRYGAMLRTSRSRPATRPCLGPAGDVAACVAVGLLALLSLGLPAIGLVSQTGIAGGSAALSAEEWASLLYSACYAAVAASASLALALVLLRDGAVGATSWLTLAAMAVPSIVLGSAYVIAFNGVLPLYGTPLLLLVGYVTTHLAVLTRFLRAPLSHAHTDMTDAARLHGMAFWSRIERVHAPPLLRPLLWGWSIAFGGVFFELPLSSLLYPVGRPSVGVEMLGLDETLRFGAEARLALCGGATCLAVVALVAIGVPRLLGAGRAPAAGRSA